MSTTIPEGQTVSSSYYYHVCAGCVEKDQRIAALEVTIEELREALALAQNALANSH